MIYEHGNRHPKAWSVRARRRTKVFYKRNRRWGKRFKREMLERERMNKALEILAQREPYCFLPGVFTRGYLRRSKKLSEARVSCYFEVMRREIRLSTTKAWSPMP